MNTRRLPSTHLLPFKTFLCLISLLIHTPLPVKGALTADSPHVVVLKTCSGCALKSFPAVAQFILFDLPKYKEGLVLDVVARGLPRFVLRDTQGKDYRTLGISSLKLVQIRKVLSQLGMVPGQPLTEISEIESSWNPDDTDLFTQIVQATQDSSSASRDSGTPPQGNGGSRLSLTLKQKTDKEGREIRFSMKRGILDPSKLGQVESKQARGRRDDSEPTSDERTDL